MFALILKVFSGLIALILIAILGLWILGRQQPSQKLSGHTRVVFLSLKHQDPGFVRRTNFGGDEALWQASTVLPLIGVNDPYWTDYLILPEGTALLGDPEMLSAFEDVYAAEVELTKVPAIFLGLLRAQHFLGTTKRPDGPLPEVINAEMGRTDLLPTTDTALAMQTLPEGQQLTMVNYLAYVQSETGAKEAGRRMYNRYGIEAMKAVHMVGGQFLFAGQITEVLIVSETATTAGVWDDLAAMIYPDPTAIFYMEQSSDYRDALSYRDQSLVNTIVIATEAH